MSVALISLVISLTTALYENAHKKDAPAAAKDGNKAVMQSILQHEYEVRVEKCVEIYAPASRLDCLSWSLTADGACDMSINFDCLDMEFEATCRLLLVPYSSDPCIDVRIDAAARLCNIQRRVDCARDGLVQDALKLASGTASWATYILNKFK